MAQAADFRHWNRRRPGRGAGGRGPHGLNGWYLSRRLKGNRPGPERHMLVTGISMALLILLTLGLVLGFTAVSVAAQTFAALTRDLPSITQLATRDVFQTTQIFDRNGILLSEIYDQTGGRRTLASLREISPWLIDATIAAEDADFYDNPGVDTRGIVRAVWQQLSKSGNSGASTITQQLVRNTLLPEDERSRQTLLRKFKEAVLAYRVNELYSKDDILEMYLNEVFYGNSSYGITAAAESYFGKSPRDLTLAEASLLAGLPQSPSNYNPRQNWDAARQRQAYVLDQMTKHGFITEAEAGAAWDQDLTLVEPKQEEIKAPHWVFYVRDLIEQKYGPRLLYQGGLQVYTSLDLRLQEKLEEVARNNEANLRIRNGSNTAIVAIDPKTGEILAMVGSMDFNNPAIDGQVNVATSPRQPGSSIKPIVYLTAFEKAGFTPNTVLQDVPKCFNAGAGQPPYCPVNFDNKFRGPVPVRIALGNSLNIPAVETLERIGVPAAIEMANRLGITGLDDPNRYGLAFTLGGAEVKPLELTEAYATFANQGRRVPLVAIRKMVDGHDRVIEEARPTDGEQVVDPRLVYMLTSILTDNNNRLITYGPSNLLQLSRPAAAKTGTTDNFRDTWTMGFTPNLAIGVWVGNSDGRPMREVLSSMSAGKIWHESMEEAFKILDLPVENFQRPDGLADVPVCGPGGCTTDLMPVERAPRGAPTPARR
ncbi:MAG TPA: PBP1A family penicillin-binding protein [Chloroflexota bacterium]|nr:PBP1A family penicillin-binding protein [Chloroflexota bacterium]